jgi:hypothetical protein
MLAREQNAKIEGQTFGLSACAAGWAIGEATYYTQTTPSYQVTLAAVFKWSQGAAWQWKSTYGQEQAQSASTRLGMPRGLAYALELEAKSCPTVISDC